VGEIMDIENEIDDKVSLDSLKEEDSLAILEDDKIIEAYNEIDAFLKLVEEEIKKTDVGDSSE
jgi:hypothetical protein